MKILKTKTYDKLISDSKELVEANQLLASLELISDQKTEKINQQAKIIAKLQEKYEVLSKYSIGLSKKIAIVGGKGTGKTTLIRQAIKGRNDFFILDILNTYTDIPETNRFVPTKDTDFNPLELMKVIESNRDKVIIIDDAELLRTGLDWFYEISRNLDYILVFNNESNVKKDYFDFVHFAKLNLSKSFGISPAKPTQRYYNNATVDTILGTIAVLGTIFAGLKLLTS